MPQGKFEFRGDGLSFLGTWIINWILCVITLGFYFPWAYVALQNWVSRNTSIDNRQLTFKGSGAGFFGTYLLIAFLTVITFGLYAPWGFCRFLRWQTQNTYFAEAGDNELSGANMAVAAAR